MLRFILLILSLSILSASCEFDTKRQASSLVRHISFSDSIKMNNYYVQAKSLLYSAPDSATKYIDSLFTIAKANNDISNLALANKMYANIAHIQSDYKRSIEFCNLAVDGFKAVGDTSNIGRVYMNIGINYIFLSDFTASKRALLEAEKFLKHTTDFDGLAILYGNFGTYYDCVEKFDSSLFYLLKEQNILDQIKRGNLGDLYGKMGNLYSKMENYDFSKEYTLKAIEYFEKEKNEFALAGMYVNLAHQCINTGQLNESLSALEIAESLSKKIENNLILAHVYNNLGSTYYLLNNYTKSEHYYLRSLALIDLINENSLKTTVLLNLGELYQTLNNPIKAKQYIDEGFALSGDIKSKGLIANSYKLYSTFYSKSQNFKLAFEFFKKYAAIKDSIFSKEKFKIVEELNTRYKTEKKEEELAAKGLLLKAQKMAIISLSGGVILLMLSLGFILFLFRKKTQANIELVKRNRELSDLKKGSGKERNGSGLKVSEEKIESLLEELNFSMKVEKIFLDPELTLNSLASKLKTNREYLSQLLNNVIGKNFIDYVNDYRIEEAKAILTNEANKKSGIQTMVGIANAVGFKNTSTFNPIFKRITGLTPSEYKKAAEKVSE